MEIIQHPAKRQFLCKRHNTFDWEHDFERELFFTWNPVICLQKYIYSKLQNDVANQKTVSKNENFSLFIKFFSLMQKNDKMNKQNYFFIQACSNTSNAGDGLLVHFICVAK